MLAIPTTVRERLSSAFAVLFGRHGDLTRLAEGREQSRQSLYREADRVVEDLKGTEAQGQVAELQQQNAELRARLAEVEQRPQRAIEITEDKQAEFASTAQAEGVSLPVARRVLAVLTRQPKPSEGTLGRPPAAAAQRATGMFAVLEGRTPSRVQEMGRDRQFFCH